MNSRSEMESFRKGIHKVVKKYDYETKDYSIFENFPLNDKQCLYVAHWAYEGMIYEKNLEKLTGYTLDEFSPEDLVGFTHPEDRQIVKDITKGVVKHVIETPFNGTDSHLFISFRFLKKDGTYCKILRQSSAFERDKKGRMVSNFSLLTDITFLDTPDRVEWDVQADELNIKAFKSSIYKAYQNFFTKREKEIIMLIDKGNTSDTIANNLSLSPHTVLTHRKNILRKAKSHSQDDLILFCKKNGIII